jgi:hypothetical protein
VKKENGRACSAAVLGVSELAATYQREQFAVVHEIPTIFRNRAWSKILFPAEVCGCNFLHVDLIWFS